MRIAINTCGGANYRWTSDAIRLIRDVCERELIQTFQEAQVLADHNHRVGIKVEDLVLARKLTNSRQT